MFDANILAGIQGMQGTANSINTLSNAMQTNELTTEAKGKYKEWQSPEQVAARKEKAIADATLAKYESGATKIKLEAMDANPDLWRQHITSGIDLQTRKNISEMDDMDFEDTIKMMPLDGLKTIDDVADWQKHVMTQLPAERAMKVLGNMPSIEQMKQDPHLIAQLNMRLASQMYGAKDRVKAALENSKQNRLDAREAQSEAGRNARATAANATRIEQAGLTRDATLAAIGARGDEARRTQAELLAAKKEMQQKEWEAKTGIEDKKILGKIEAVRAKVQAGGKAGSPLKFNTDSGIGNQKQATTDAGMYVTGRLKAEGFDTKLAGQIAPDVVAKASSIWQAKNAAYAAELAAGNPEALPPPNGREIVQQLTEQAIQRIQEKKVPIVGSDKYTPESHTEGTTSEAPKRVKVVGPNGEKGTLPESQVEEAIKRGYKRAE